MRKIELLAPAGNEQAFKAAVINGADAIYVGGRNFSARAYAENFDNDKLAELIRYAHIKGVKVHVGINTLLYDAEIDNVLNYIDFLYTSDVDALIVSDIGLINIISMRYPRLEIHVSTQLNTHSLWQVKFLESLNVSRVVLSREVDISTIKYIKENSNVDLEVFAHGALCVCYSGNCLHSSMIGKRSGNRGMCAQPCRMQYALSADGKIISDKKYMLSMKDLNTLDNIDKLIEAGVCSLKIEGRMKSAEYVAIVTKAYREAIDRYYQAKRNVIDPLMLSKLSLTFSRGFTHGYLFNEKNSELTNTFRPNHIGEKVGVVIGSSKGKVKIRLDAEVKQKDKIAFIQNHFDDIGIYLSKIFVRDKIVGKAYKGEVIEIEMNSRVENGAIVNRVVDSQLLEQIQESYQKDTKKIFINMKFISNVNKPLSLLIKDNDSHIVSVNSKEIVEQAINCPTSDEKIYEQLNKLGNTAYIARNISIISDGNGIIPVKTINDLRREAIALLDDKRANFHKREITEINHDISFDIKDRKVSRKFKVKVQNIYQLEAISELDGIDEIYYNDPYTYELAKNKYPKLNIVPVMGRIDNCKAKIDSSIYVVNNYGDLLKYQNSRLITDMYMNIANYTSVLKLAELGVESITLSPEMSKEQIEELTNKLNDELGFIPSLEMVVYGRCQTMVSNYCFISKELGYEKKNCGGCRNSHFTLIDRMNYKFPVLTDNDCNVTVYNSKALHLLQFVDDIYNLSINSIRLDFSIENPEEVYNITKAYLDKINQNEYYLNIHDVTYGYYLDKE